MVFNIIRLANFKDSQVFRGFLDIFFSSYAANCINRDTHPIKSQFADSFRQVSFTRRDRAKKK